MGCTTMGPLRRISTASPVRAAATASANVANPTSAWPSLPAKTKGFVGGDAARAVARRARASDRRALADLVGFRQGAGVDSRFDLTPLFLTDAHPPQPRG